MTITTNQLVDNVKARALVTDNQQTITDEAILRWANDELAQFIVPMIKERHEEYFVVEETQTVVPGQDSYRIPQRALGGSFRNISLTNASGRTFHLNRIAREDRERFKNSSEPMYYLQGNSIRLVPEPTAEMTLTFGYLRRPSKMVFADGAKMITQVIGNLVSVTSIPLWMTINTRFDIVDALYPAEINQANAQPISIGGNRVTLASAEGAKVGDFLTEAGTTHLVPIQEELVPLLEERTALRVFTALGDTNSVATTQNNIAEMIKALGDLIDNRASGDPVVLVNHFSPMRQARR